MGSYQHQFYDQMDQKTAYAAEMILSMVLAALPRVESAVDVGCGVGTWLRLLQDKGVQQLLGLDGSWVKHDLLVIPPDLFQQTDLSTRFALPRRYDLALSMEVAEHIPPDRASIFIESLTSLSDFVLFSAAVPYQGGTHHYNEQWQHFWVELLSQYDYVVHDFIRARIWQDSRIPYWYRQNTLLFSVAKRANEVQAPAGDRFRMPLDVVHPELFAAKMKLMKDAYTPRGIARAIWTAARSRWQ